MNEETKMPKKSILQELQCVLFPYRQISLDFSLLSLFCLFLKTNIGKLWSNSDRERI